MQKKEDDLPTTRHQPPFPPKPGIRKTFSQRDFDELKQSVEKLTASFLAFQPKLMKLNDDQFSMGGPEALMPPKPITAQVGNFAAQSASSFQFLDKSEVDFPALPGNSTESKGIHQQN